MEKIAPETFREITGKPSHEFRDILSDEVQVANRALAKLSHLLELSAHTIQEPGKTPGHWIPCHNLTNALTCMKKAEAALMDMEEYLRREGCSNPVRWHNRHTDHLERIL